MGQNNGSAARRSTAQHSTAQRDGLEAHKETRASKQRTCRATCSHLLQQRSHLVWLHLWQPLQQVLVRLLEMLAATAHHVQLQQ
jgi:hypothetical protein